jgi:acyl-coenzyme A synthetase/AMP-(fatty) acid ligase
MNIFLANVEKNRIVSWSQLIEDIKNTNSFNPYCKSSDYYTIFKQIILSLLAGEEITLLDSDFTENELIKLTGYSNFEDFNKPFSLTQTTGITDKIDLLNKLNSTSENWKITLFTSGTTGLPKKVSHNFSSISRFVRISEQNQNSVWGFAYNPTHMAGVQVFFQALLNGNSIIRLFGLNTEEIYGEIENHHITHISATPTFYKLLINTKHLFPSVKRITSGGEKFNDKVFEQLIKIFPNAKITNVYASTEAGTLFASHNDVFSIRKEFEDLIIIKNNELMIHKSLMGSSNLQIDKWYDTGDLVEIISEQPLKFRFLNRKSEMINIGGYKVNPNEVEDAISSMQNIENVRVYAKSNSVLGNIICCEVVTKDEQVTEASIRTFLQSVLQEYKIPRIIRFVEELTTTRTGKLKRN